MSATSHDVLFVTPHHLGWLDKLASYAAWGLAGWLFFSVGWVALEPVDPLGPVSLTTGRGAPAMLMQASLLAIIAAAIGTTLIGKKLVDAGTFAAALGLAVLALRGGTMEFLLVRTADHVDASDRMLALSMSIESLGWIIVIAIAMIASTLMTKWMFSAEIRSAGSPSNDLMTAPAGWDIPLWGALLGRPASAGGSSPAEGARHTVIGAPVMLVAHWFLTSGRTDRMVTHGQSCFIVFASVCIGVYVAFRFAPIRSALWPILSVFAYAIAGYLLASMSVPSGTAQPTVPAAVPASRFLLALPIQVVGVGCAAAVFSFWWRSAAAWHARMMMQAADPSRQRSVWD